jgi:hypothetical protein
MSAARPSPVVGYLPLSIWKTSRAASNMVIWVFALMKRLEPTRRTEAMTREISVMARCKKCCLTDRRSAAANSASEAAQNARG